MRSFKIISEMTIAVIGTVAALLQLAPGIGVVAALAVGSGLALLVAFAEFMLGGIEQQEQQKGIRGCFNTIVGSGLFLGLAVCGVLAILSYQLPDIISSFPTVVPYPESHNSGLSDNNNSINYVSLNNNNLAAGCHPEPLPSYFRNTAGGLTSNLISYGYLPSSMSHIWMFQGSRGENIQLQLSASVSTFDTFVELWSEDDNLLASADNSDVMNTNGSLNAILNYILPYTGTYFITICDLTARGGPYELTLYR